MNQEESNFLSKLSDAWLVALLCVVVPGMFSTGFYLGTQQVDREAKEMITQNRELKDSLVVFRTAAIKKAANTQEKTASRRR